MHYLTNLNVRSNYSFLSSTISLKKYLTFAIKHELKTLVLTDENVLYGSYEFYQLCRFHQIKPIIGLDCKLYFSNLLFNLTIIAATYQGYQIINEISTMINSENKQLNIEQLQSFINSDQNIFLIIKTSDYELEQLKLVYEAINNQNYQNIYFGVSINNSKLVSTLSEITRAILPVNTVKYLIKEEVKIFEILQAIKNQTTISENDLSDEGNEFYHSSDELAKYFPQWVINNINSIINKCDWSFPEYNSKEKVKNLPKFPCPNNLTSASYLKELCRIGLQKRFQSTNVPQKYITRLFYELEIINLMDFSDYFLIVYDYVLFARENNIIYGPGRGSAAGSLVAYVLEITNVDPLKYDLIFERFLNPERQSLPDIDIDFEDERREEIILYLSDKYGANHVAHILTFQTIACKMAIRDLGRVFSVSLEEVNEMSKLIAPQANFNLSVALSSSPKLKQYQQKFSFIFAVMEDIIGFPRQTSTHAAGVVLSFLPLPKHVALQKGFNNVMLTQLPMNDLEAIGLVKMDILGLRNLTILKNILMQIKTIFHETIDLNKIDINDQKAFIFLKNGDTTGIFQLESPGMRQILKAMKTNSLEDIIACSSLFRPGPQEYINTYVQRKLHKEPVSYLHADLVSILKPTYGIIVYQEQILLILQKIAGYTLAQADLIRRAIAKKDQNKMNLQGNDFLNAALKKGYSEKVANAIWDDIKKFAGYGFNRSHAVAYSLIGYWLAYLKANYPLVFMSCLLTSVIGNDQKLLQYLNECYKYKIKILPPSVNKSLLVFSIDQKQNAIIYSLCAIKQMSQLSCQNLINERQENGVYNEFFNFCARVIFAGLNKRNIEFLISAGALDEINNNRTMLMNNLENALKYAIIVQNKNKKTKEIELDLSLSKPTLVSYENDWKSNGANEQKALGFYLKYNPETQWKHELDPENKAINLNEVDNYLQKSIIVLGMIISHKIIKTKNNELMAFAVLQSDNTWKEITFFPRVYQQYQDAVQNNKVLSLVVKISQYQDKTNLIVEKVISNL